ncbi:MAG: hypothetical protein ACOYXM_12520 [Actinomycetota bacterium]
MLGDGTYDVIVVDAEPLADEAEPVAGGAGVHSAMRLDLTILGGPHKGEVVSMRAVGLDIDEIDALGLPGTLTVQEGEPTVALDR